MWLLGWEMGYSIRQEVSSNIYCVCNESLVMKNWILILQD